MAPGPTGHCPAGNRLGEPSALCRRSLARRAIGLRPIGPTGHRARGRWSRPKGRQGSLACGQWLVGPATSLWLGSLRLHWPPANWLAGIDELGQQQTAFALRATGCWPTLMELGCDQQAGLASIAPWSQPSGSEASPPDGWRLTAGGWLDKPAIVWQTFGLLGFTSGS